ncbi:MAG: aminodeoxychorismate/anthranilate synthase component II [Fluviicola sp.]|nr:aminodeoxychorismate/anthranilate synthase component II [Fluviicola sp.]
MEQKAQTKVLLIDNYDSFTYNLLHYLEALGCAVAVVRNDVLSADILSLYTKILISPGPGLPNEAGQLMDFLRESHSTKSILGICLGQQALAELFGGTLEALPQVQHGTEITLTHDHNDFIYHNIPTHFNVGLYHSWHTTHLPEFLVPTAISPEGIIMSFKHQFLDIRAVQYHPESIMTEYGLQILKNWIEN